MAVLRISWPLRPQRIGTVARRFPHSPQSVAFAPFCPSRRLHCSGSCWFSWSCRRRVSTSRPRKRQRFRVSHMVLDLRRCVSPALLSSRVALAAYGSSPPLCARKRLTLSVECREALRAGTQRVLDNPGRTFLTAPARCRRREVSVWGLCLGAGAALVRVPARFSAGLCFRDGKRRDRRVRAALQMWPSEAFSRFPGMAPRQRGAQRFRFRGRCRAWGGGGMSECQGHDGCQVRGGPRGRWLASSSSTPPQCGQGGGAGSRPGRSPKKIRTRSRVCTRRKRFFAAGCSQPT